MVHSWIFCPRSGINIGVNQSIRKGNPVDFLIYLVDFLFLISGMIQQYFRWSAFFPGQLQKTQKSVYYGQTGNGEENDP